MKKILMVAIALLLGGCVTPPQTTQDLRVGVREGARLTKMEQVEVARSFNATFNSIKKNADKCFNLSVTSSTHSKYGPVYSTTRWRSSSEKTGDGMAETVIQLDARATGKMPPGGYFSLLVDIESISKNKIKVTIYGSSIGYGQVFEAIFRWAEGKERKCPKKPFGGLGSKYEYHKQ